MKIEGIIIRISQYKDNDAMINVLSNDKLISFYVRGIFKLDNKNSLLNSPLSFGEFTFSDNKDKLTFKEFNPIIDTRIYINDFSKLVAINFINEVTLKLFLEEDMITVYPYLLKTLNTLKGNINIPLLLLFYLANALKLTGYGLEVDKCVILGQKTDIVGISYIDGGFVSRNAYNSKFHKQCTPKEIVLIRKIFKSEFNSVKENEFDKETIKKVFNDMFMYTYDQVGTRFISESLLLKLL